MQLPLPMFPFRTISIGGSMVGSLGETQEMMKLVREGKVDPIPYQKRPLSEANKSLNDLREGHVTGRVILTP
jgi:D-arabinose 1-dehydrogenase-like Zn-dependent alcohol dehydrogenase